MLYDLERDPVRDRKIVQQCIRQKRPIPDKIANAPALMLGLDLYYDAFLDLATCRSVGMSAGAIPMLDIRDYAIAYEFDEEQEADLLILIRQMDNEYIKFYSKKAES